MRQTVPYEQKPAISACALVNALGTSPREIWQRLFCIESRPFQATSDYSTGDAQWIGKVPSELPPLSELPARFRSRNNQLALLALEQIRDQVLSVRTLYGPERIAVVIGSSTSGISRGEEAVAYAEKHQTTPSDYCLEQQELGSSALYLRDALGLSGPAYTISTACSSSARAFSSASNLLAMDICDAVLVGGIDSLCKLTLQGFSALELIAKEPCNPFSRNRSGITIGEGAALFLLEKNRGCVKLLGTGESSDAYHMSSPHPEGLGAEIAIKSALSRAGLDASDIHYINLHGTGTKANDLIESHVVARLFPHAPLASSTKGMTGHLLGAGSATEAAFCFLSLTGDSADISVPPHAWDGEVDPDLAPINFADLNSKIPANGLVSMLSTSFAFGGNNSCLIFGRDYANS